MLTESQIDGIVEFDLNDEMSDGRAAQAITQLRAELAAERELADRLASAGVNMKRAAELRGNVGFPQMDAAITAHATRRNK